MGLSDVSRAAAEHRPTASSATSSLVPAVNAAQPGPPGLAAPQLSLPRGGGAIRGIGETFTTNPVNGTAGLTVPIATSPGRSGFGPQLTLAYDSGSGNGPF